MRGLDYYNLTRVRVRSTDHLGSQGTICAGGRYDDLIEQIGGKPAPAVGLGLGVERVLRTGEGAGTPVPCRCPTPMPSCPTAAACPRLPVLQRCARPAAASRCTPRPTAGSMKSQFKKADASGARYALIFGADDGSGMVTVKRCGRAPRDGGPLHAQPTRARLGDDLAA